MADEVNGQVHAIDSNGNVTHNVFNWSPPSIGKGAENVNVIPETLCTFGCTAGGPGAFFQMIYDYGFILYYGPIDFQGLGGNVIVTTEAEPPDTTTGTLLVTFNAVTNSYDTTVFDPIFNFTINEGAKFVDCDAVTPTPTPTATLHRQLRRPDSNIYADSTDSYVHLQRQRRLLQPLRQRLTATATATATPTPTPTPTPAEGNFSWTGATNTIWKTSTNWSPSVGAPPGASADRRLQRPIHQPAQCHPK